MPFTDRVDAGRRLGMRLRELRGQDVVVLGLPRGGVPVAAEVARALDAPLDVIVVRKLGVPYQPEVGMGAIGEDGVRVVDRDIVRQAGITETQLATVEARERTELERRARRFRGDRPLVPVTGRTVVIVDDGIATGSTARAACQVARARGAARIVVAVPVAPSDWTARLRHDADELVCLLTPEPFWSIGGFYADFSQTSDDEVVACLHGAARRAAGDAGSGPPPPTGLPGPRDEEVVIDVGGVRLRGHLTVPEDAAGVVVFAHGSGSSRHSPRNQFVAGELNRAGLGTLLFDLLTTGEEQDRANVFDVALLTRRLVDVTRWTRSQPGLGDLPVGYFGASTGAAAALSAAAVSGGDVAAVVSRGGRPDLAGHLLGSVTAPTLLIVGERDHEVLALNRDARTRLGGQSALAIVPTATHLFEEPGTLATAAELAREWFTARLVPAARRDESPRRPAPGRHEEASDARHR